jgi:nifR3 family TIM-barrel protein
MDGVTDMPFRGLCRKFGSAISITEFINTLDVLTNHPRYDKRLAFEPFHRPLSLQFLGDEADQILKAAEILVPQVQPDLIDINLGCQSRNVVARGAGAALLRQPSKIGAIFKLLTAEFEIPITGKIRLGWDDDNLNYLEVAQTIQDHGGAMIAVHGRSRQQAYRGKARWEPIAEIKKALQIPVIGNGDVTHVADIQRIKDETGCDAVMIGRGAVGNPWIFSRMDRVDVHNHLVYVTIKEHLQSMLAFYGERGVITFRKYLKGYLQPYGFPKDTLHQLLICKQPDQVLEQVANLLVPLE